MVQKGRLSRSRGMAGRYVRVYGSCGDSRVDVKGKIGIAVKRLEIKGFKTKGSIFECCFWSFFFLSVETYRKAENGRVVATLLI